MSTFTTLAGLGMLAAASVSFRSDSILSTAQGDADLSRLMFERVLKSRKCNRRSLEEIVKAHGYNSRAKALLELLRHEHFSKKDYDKFTSLTRAVEDIGILSYKTRMEFARCADVSVR